MQPAPKNVLQTQDLLEEHQAAIHAATKEAL